MVLHTKLYKAASNNLLQHKLLIIKHLSFQNRTSGIIKNKISGKCNIFIADKIKIEKGKILDILQRQNEIFTRHIIQL